MKERIVTFGCAFFPQIVIVVAFTSVKSFRFNNFHIKTVLKKVTSVIVDITKTIRINKIFSKAVFVIFSTCR